MASDATSHDDGDAQNHHGGVLLAVPLARWRLGVPIVGSPRRRIAVGVPATETEVPAG